MDKNLEQSQKVEESGSDRVDVPDTSGTDGSRRRFTRGAVLASGVVLTLSNRAAWSQDAVCLSANTVASAMPATGPTPASVSPGTQAQVDDFNDLINSGYTEVENPASPGGKCAVPPP